MPSTNDKQETDDTRQQIQQAAEARFGVYGYNKTTMAEIAEDTGMSAANIYRFFENKEEIAAACANRCMCERIDRLREAIRQPVLSAVQRLQAYVLTTLQVSHEMAMENKKIHEIITTITDNRPDLVHQKIDAETALLTEILAYGNEKGEFAIDDVITTARTIHMTLVVFDVPLFMGLFPYDEFEEKARAVVSLLVSGLKRYE
jgi:AcrR family transcriptional regulator